MPKCWCTGLKQWQCHTHCTSTEGRRAVPVLSPSLHSEFPASAANGIQQFRYLHNYVTTKKSRIELHRCVSTFTKRSSMHAVLCWESCANLKFPQQQVQFAVSWSKWSAKCSPLNRSQNRRGVAVQACDAVDGAEKAQQTLGCKHEIHRDFYRPSASQLLFMMRSFFLETFLGLVHCIADHTGRHKVWSHP